jgi:hypothetical protein
MHSRSAASSQRFLSDALVLRREKADVLRLKPEPPQNYVDAGEGIRELLRETRKLARRAGLVSAGLTAVVVVVVFVFLPSFVSVAGAVGLVAGTATGITMARLSARIRRIEKKLGALANRERPALPLQN